MIDRIPNETAIIQGDQKKKPVPTLSAIKPELLHRINQHFFSVMPSIWSTVTQKFKPIRLIERVL